LIPLATGLGMKVRGPRLSGKSGTNPAPPSSHRWGAQANNSVRTFTNYL